MQLSSANWPSEISKAILNIGEDMSRRSFFRKFSCWKIDDSIFVRLNNFVVRQFNFWTCHCTFNIAKCIDILRSPIVVTSATIGFGFDKRWWD